MSKKIYIAMNAIPWESLAVAIGKTPEGEIHSVKASGDEENAGFLAVYWTREAAERAHPDIEIKEGEVGDNWAVSNVPQGDQDMLILGHDIEAMEKGEMLTLAKSTEDKLGLTVVAMARARVLKGKPPTARLGAKKIKAYLTELHTAVEATTQPRG